MSAIPPTPIRTPTANAAVGTRRDRNAPVPPVRRRRNHAAIGAANGTRFGRIRIASAAHTPAAAAELTDVPRRKYHAIVHAAMAGTSLSGSRDPSTTGLVATSHAAISPQVRAFNRHPRPYVARTASPLSRGTTR